MEQVLVLVQDHWEKKGVLLDSCVDAGAASSGL